MDYLRTAGLDIDDEFRAIRGTVNDSKLEESIIRAKSRIFELAYCNPWDFFFTGTIDPNKFDRTDLEKFHKVLTQFLRNYARLHNLPKIDFLFIPELHSDGKSWHIHGFIHGLPIEHLKQFQIGDTMGKSLAQKVKNGDIVYNWLSYSKKFGFCDLEPIRNHEAVSKYITKYINKSLATSVTKLNAHLYYHSRGLNTAVTMKKGTMLLDIAPNFVGEHCSISWFDYDVNLLDTLISGIV